MSDRTPGGGIDGELLDRYLAHECMEEEVAIVRRYLMAHPELAKALASFLSDLDDEAARPTPPDASESWSRLQARQHEGEEEFPPDSRAPSAVRQAAVKRRRHLFALLPSPRRGSGLRRIVYSALAAGVVVAGVFSVMRQQPAPTPPPPEQTFATVNRERAELRLTDGTRVRLAPASRIRVTANYGEQDRTVFLDGQAYFEVKHDSTRPFAVHAGTTIARDIGTDFAVRSYPEDRAVQVVVRTGSVAMSNVGRLDAGDVGRLGYDGISSVTRGVAVAPLLAWLDGHLVFHDAPLATVIEELRRWYDADVRLADSKLGSLPFTGVLTDASFRSSIDLVAATLGLRVRRAGNTVMLARIGGLTPSLESPAARHPAR